MKKENVDDELLHEAAIAAAVVTMTQWVRETIFREVFKVWRHTVRLWRNSERDMDRYLRGSYN